MVLNKIDRVLKKIACNGFLLFSRNDLLSILTIGKMNLLRLIAW